jgi:hypothetical protein
MDPVQVRGLRPVAAWAWVVLPLVLAVLGVGTARADFVGPSVNTDQIVHQFDWLEYVMTGISVLTVVGAGALGLGFGVHVYMRWTRPSDPLKVALSDPWVRAHLERLGDAAGAEAPGPENADGVQADPPTDGAGPPA